MKDGPGAGGIWNFKGHFENKQWFWDVLLPAERCDYVNVQVNRRYLQPWLQASTLDSLRGSSVNIGTIQRSLACPLRKDDMHKSRSANNSLDSALA